MPNFRELTTEEQNLQNGYPPGFSSFPMPRGKDCASYSTDVEGRETFFAGLQANESLLMQELGLSDASTVNKKTIKIFGGDASDNGAHDLRILFHFKTKTENREEDWLLVGGNREYNKYRAFVELLNESYVTNFLSWNKGPHWDQGKTPLAFVKRMLSADKGNPTIIKAVFGADSNLNADSTDDNIKGAFSSLDFHKKQLLVTHWMLTDTLGSGRKFEHRRKELQALYSSPGQQVEISDEMVMASFIEEVLTPEELQAVRDTTPQLLPMDNQVLPDEYVGVTDYYIKNAKVTSLMGDTAIQHGAWNDDNFMKYADGSEFPREAPQAGPYAELGKTQPERAALLAWMDYINQSAIDAYSDIKQSAFPRGANGEVRYSQADLSQGVGREKLNRSYSLPQKGGPDSDSTLVMPTTLVSVNPTANDEKKPKMELNEGNRAFLRQAGVKRLLMGHQPVADKAMVTVRPQGGEGGFELLMLDPSVEPVAQGQSDGVLPATAIMDIRNGGRVVQTGQFSEHNKLAPAAQYRIEPNNPEHCIGYTVECDGKVHVVNNFITSGEYKGQLRLDCRGSVGPFMGVAAVQFKTPEDVLQLVVDQAQRMTVTQLKVQLPRMTPEQIGTVVSNQALNHSQKDQLKTYLHTLSPQKLLAVSQSESIKEETEHLLKDVLGQKLSAAQKAINEWTQDRTGGLINLKEALYGSLLSDGTDTSRINNTKVTTLNEAVVKGTEGTCLELAQRLCTIAENATVSRNVRPRAWGAKSYSAETNMAKALVKHAVVSAPQMKAVKEEMTTRAKRATVSTDSNGNGLSNRK